MADFERDRTRWDTIGAAGYGLLVYTAEHVEHRPAFVVDTVTAALAGRGPLGRAA